ncbi:hypothetical protein [Prosthecobacter sp.]|uniref:hypothetical protein n=1 Tax=Prosthecobacter sp. TaxID=1965333 RepID=UPI0037846F23
MKRRISILAGFTLLTVFTDYVSGRWALFFLIPPMLFPAFLTLLAAVWVLLPCRDGGPFWRRWALRIAALAACWGGLLRLPSYLEEDDDYFKMGRRAHIRSTFTPAVIAELHAAAAKLTARKGRIGGVVLSEADLPPAVGGTLWGMPGYAACSFNKEGRLSSVRLVWGGSLIGRHGLVISDEEIPFRGDGFHGGGKDGHEEVYYPERYYPLYPGAYIYLDEN